MIYKILSKEIIYKLLKTLKEKRGRRGKRLSQEIITENFPNPGRDLNIQFHEYHRSTKKKKNLNLQKSSPKYIIINTVKNHRQKESFKEVSNLKGTPKLSVNFSAKTLQIRREYIKVLKEKTANKIYTLYGKVALPK